LPREHRQVAAGAGGPRRPHGAELSSAQLERAVVPACPAMARLAVARLVPVSTRTALTHVITKDFRTYKRGILRQDKTLRDHGTGADYRVTPAA
jgi:hypothetical protein